MHEGHRERLRKRYQEEGLDNFEDHEVLELLLTYSIPRANTNDTAHELLDRFGSLLNVFGATIQELRDVKGVGDRSAVLLHFCMDLLRRIRLEEQRGGKKRAHLPNPYVAGKYVQQLLLNERYECIYAVCMDKNKRVLHSKKLVEGTLAETVLYPRTLVEYSLQNKAYSVVLAHNHPSGDPRPSEADWQTTENARKALEVIGITLFDHLIVGGQMVFSFSQNIAFLIEHGNQPHVLLDQEVDFMAGEHACAREHEEAIVPLPGGEVEPAIAYAAENTQNNHQTEDDQT